MLAVGVLLSVLVSAALLGELVLRGFRNGDRPGDIRVTVGSVLHPDGSAGAWCEIRVENPGEQIALIGVLSRRALLGGPDARGTAPWRANRRLTDQQLGTVTAGGEESFWVWNEPADRRARVLVIVGTSGRLRKHVLGLRYGDPASQPEPAAVPVGS